MERFEARLQIIIFTCTMHVKLALLQIVQLGITYKIKIGDLAAIKTCIEIFLYDIPEWS